MQRSVIHISKDILKIFREGKKLTINEVDHKFTKAEKLVFLAYSSKVYKLDNEIEGITPIITNTEIASMCNLSVATVISARNSLNELGLIKVESIDKFKHQIIIIGYERLHLTRKEGGTGYVKIAYNMFQELCKLGSNELRIAFDLILSIDSDSANNYNKSDSLTRNYSFIKKYLPSYVDCKKKVQEILKKLKGLFNLKFEDNSIKAKEVDSYKVKNYHDTIYKGNRKGLKRILKNNNISFNSKDLTDLVKMSMEYSYTAISNSLMYIFLNNIVIEKSLGALVRSLIKNSFMRYSA